MSNARASIAASENAAAEIKELNNRLLKELAQKERLASLGQASAEFVHDLGNPLTIVWGYVQLLAKKLEKSENEQTTARTKSGSAKELNIIEQNVRLCRELLTMWQSYGSVEAAPHKPISVSAIVREIVKGVGAMATQNGVELRVEVCEDPCTLAGRRRADHARHSKCHHQRHPGLGRKKGRGHGSLHAARISTSTCELRIRHAASLRRR